MGPGTCSRGGYGILTFYHLSSFLDCCENNRPPFPCSGMVSSAVSPRQQIHMTVHPWILEQNNPPFNFHLKTLPCFVTLRESCLPPRVPVAGMCERHRERRKPSGGLLGSVPLSFKLKLSHFPVETVARDGCLMIRVAVLSICRWDIVVAGWL